VHHDIPLPAFPLCLAHGQVSANATPGNFCAVGTFHPGIEIWNLDVLNALEPSCVLGGEDTSRADDFMRMNIRNATHQSSSSAKRTPTATMKAVGLLKGSHADAVMSLSWNQTHKQVLASGSADHTVKLWDVTKAGDTDASTLTHHKGKVGSVAWNPAEGTLLATGSFDRTVCLLDARSPHNVKKVKITADCETMAWDPIHTQCLTVASEDGMVACWDVRKFQTSTPLWSMVANEYGGITDLSYNAQVPGLMVTCSIDKTITLWDVHQNGGGGNASMVPTPKPCGTKDMCVGKLYTVGFYPSAPWLLACGGSGNELALWDLSEEVSIQEQFRGRLLRSHSRSDTEANIGASGDIVDHSLKGMIQSGPNDATAPADKVENTRETRNNKKSKGKAKRKSHRKS
jgi:periodic tryptophan protein 1